MTVHWHSSFPPHNTIISHVPPFHPHSPRHSSSLLTHCVQPLPVVSQRYHAYTYGLVTHTPTAHLLSPHSYFLIHSSCVSLCFSSSHHQMHAKTRCVVARRHSKAHHRRDTWITLTTKQTRAPQLAETLLINVTETRH